MPPRPKTRERHGAGIVPRGIKRGESSATDKTCCCRSASSCVHIIARARENRISRKFPPNSRQCESFGVVCVSFNLYDRLSCETKGMTIETPRTRDGSHMQTKGGAESLLLPMSQLECMYLWNASSYLTRLDLFKGGTASGALGALGVRVVHL